jgi:hypothetical protein
MVLANGAFCAWTKAGDSVVISRRDNTFKNNFFFVILIYLLNYFNIKVKHFG